MANNISQETRRNQDDAELTARRERRKRLRRRERRLRRLRCILLLSLLLIFMICCLFKFANRNKFAKGTTINGIDCSKLTVEETAELFSKGIESKDITFIFGNTIYPIEAKKLDIIFTGQEQVQNAFNEQKANKKEKFFRIYSCYTVNENQLKLILNNFSEFKCTDPENAYLKLNEHNQIEIVPEVLGHNLKFEDAYLFALNNLKDGNTSINFTSIKDSILYPGIVDENLIEQQRYLNSILRTSITYTLSDKSTVTISSDITKDWLEKDKDGIYGIIDLDSHLEDFIDDLSKKANKANSYVEFIKEEEVFYLPLKSNLRVKVARDKELTRLKNEITSNSEIIRKPLYTSPVYTLDGITTYIEVDLYNQKVRMYVDGKCIVDTDCVTGSVKGGHETPPGVFTLSYKEKDAILRGTNNDGSKYASPVKYWMPFNGGIGLHDASSWRKKFGGEIYKTNGSHGCINLPIDATEKIYNNITMDMPIIVY